MLRATGPQWCFENCLALQIGSNFEDANEIAQLHLKLQLYSCHVKALQQRQVGICLCFSN